MDAKYLQEIKQREQAATKGPWKTEDRRDQICIYDRCTCNKGFGPFARVEPDEYDNADFIAEARTDIPALVAEVERLTCIVSGIMHSVDKWFDIVPDEDEINRAIGAREIALKEIERLNAEISVLKRALIFAAREIITSKPGYYQGPDDYVAEKIYESCVRRAQEEQS